MCFGFRVFIDVTEKSWANKCNWILINLRIGLFVTKIGNSKKCIQSISQTMFIAISLIKVETIPDEIALIFLLIKMCPFYIFK